MRFAGLTARETGRKAERETINQWIDTSGVIDFDQTVRDPADPLQLLPAHDAPFRSSWES